MYKIVRKSFFIVLLTSFWVSCSNKVYIDENEVCNNINKTLEDRDPEICLKNWYYIRKTFRVKHIEEFEKVDIIYLFRNGEYYVLFSENKKNDNFTKKEMRKKIKKNHTYNLMLFEYNRSLEFFGLKDNNIFWKNKKIGMKNFFVSPDLEGLYFKEYGELPNEN